MEEQFEPGKTVSKKRYINLAALFILLAAGGLGGYWAWTNYLCPEALEAKKAAGDVEKFFAAQKAFEDAMKADTFGGKTPRETLDMFIDALKKGDVELAAKYFELETNDMDPNYLTRKKWEDGLKKAKEENKLIEIIAQLERATPAGSSIEGGFGFEIKKIDDGSVEADINMHLNKYSNVWKIESL